MGSKRSGRKVLTKEVHETIIKHLRAGAFKSHAAEAAGISVDALDQWLKRGRAGEKAYVAFAQDVTRVQAEDAIRNQAIITSAAIRHIPGDWKAAAYCLERKWPKLYGRNATPIVGVTVEPNDDDNDTKTRIHFYLPDNGRRPFDHRPRCCRR